MDCRTARATPSLDSRGSRSIRARPDLLLRLLSAAWHRELERREPIWSTRPRANRQRAGLTIVIPATVARSNPGSIAAASSRPIVRSINRWGCSEPCSMSAIMPG
jgi:hypothetical protein